MFSYRRERIFEVRITDDAMAVWRRLNRINEWLAGRSQVMSPSYPNDFVSTMKHADRAGGAA
jgi:hypothetical protein